ncbi:MAG: type VI secretion system contractile sheath large subunit [Deltaproteobacteria bacterium]|nr:type VI secretion system contractile sheath large subunit [Deltaproteobacteria bacterium]
MKHYPFSVFVLAPFSKTGRATDTPPLVGPFDMYDVDEGLRSLDCIINVSLPRDVCPDGETQIKIDSIASLKPRNVVRNSAFLASLVEALDYVKKHRTDPESMAMGLQRQFGHLPLDLSVLTQDPMPQAAPEGSVSLLESILSEMEANDVRTSAPPLEVQIEEMLKTALACVYRDADFRRLESSIRGLQMLVRQGPIKKSVKTSVTLCNVDAHNIENALRHIVRSSAERSPSLVLVDLPFDNSFASIDMLETLANFSEAIHVPTVVQLSADFFGKSTWTEISAVGFLKNELKAGTYAKFRELQSAPSTRWLTLTLPKICFRNPYTVDGPVRPVAFEEPGPVQISSVWAIGTLAAKSQNAFGWPSRLTDAGICQLDQLVIPKTADRNTPLEALFDEDRISQFHEVGMAPLCGMACQTQIFLPHAPSMNNDTLGFQLFANRVIEFFHDQKKELEKNSEIRDTSVLVGHLKTAFLSKWADTDQPQPDDFTISVAYTDDTGQVVLAVRMTPSRAIVPVPKLLAFEVTFVL